MVMMEAGGVECDAGETRIAFNFSTFLSLIQRILFRVAFRLR